MPEVSCLLMIRPSACLALSGTAHTFMQLIHIAGTIPAPTRPTGASSNSGGEKPVVVRGAMQCAKALCALSCSSSTLPGTIPALTRPGAFCNTPEAKGLLSPHARKVPCNALNILRAPLYGPKQIASAIPAALMPNSCARLAALLCRATRCRECSRQSSPWCCTMARRSALQGPSHGPAADPLSCSAVAASEPAAC